MLIVLPRRAKSLILLNGAWVFRAQFRDPAMIAKYGRKTEKSLGTHVKAEAQLRAEPFLREHRLRLMEAQNLREKRIRVTGFAWRHPLGDRTEEDGTRVFATEQNVIWIKDGSKTMGKDLIRAFRALGIKDEKIVNHSLRHRAKDRLRAFGCPAETQDWICGHEEVTVSDGYGKGPPMSVLKPWIDLIGY